VKQFLRQVPCPVCGYGFATAFFNPGRYPLATLGWPESATEAKAMARHELDFLQCPSCTHVWNSAFDFDCIPYHDHPNRMFNAGAAWRGHLADTRDLILASVPRNPVVIDIGCGEGHFVRGLGEALEGDGRFIGFDLNAAGETGAGIEFHQRYFDPLEDIQIFYPDVIIIRHVMEHLLEPSRFVEQLTWGAQLLERPCMLFVEVPCIDRVFETSRLSDFFYEHISHFTTKSFARLSSKAGTVKHLGHGYGKEVVFALIELAVPEEVTESVDSAVQFEQRSHNSRLNIQQDLWKLKASGATVAIWGGTGKAAAFMQYFSVDPESFSLVVDSDTSKLGTFVPGVGQEIVSVEKLKGVDLDAVIIPSQWRARDIVREMQAMNISTKQVLIEHDGALIDFYQVSHPY
jgi:hypothetical protein